MKIRFIEPGNRPYKPTILNYFVYDRYIRTPSVGLNTLATIVKREYPDTYMYSESISKIPMKDLQDSNIIFISIVTLQKTESANPTLFLGPRERGRIF